MSSVIGDLLGTGGLADLAGKVIDHFVPDATANAAAKAALEQSAQAGQIQAILGQLQVNATEAASTNWFVAGWRPYIGWICGTGLGYQFLFMPIGNGITAAFGHAAIFPTLDTASLTSLVTGMLGFGMMRSFEKHQDVEANR